MVGDDFGIAARNSICRHATPATHILLPAWCAHSFTVFICSVNGSRKIDAALSSEGISLERHSAGDLGELPCAQPPRISARTTHACDLRTSMMVHQREQRASMVYTERNLWYSPSRVSWRFAAFRYLCCFHHLRATLERGARRSCNDKSYRLHTLLLARCCVLSLPLRVYRASAASTAPGGFRYRRGVVPPHVFPHRQTSLACALRRCRGAPPRAARGIGRTSGITLALA